MTLNFSNDKQIEVSDHDFGLILNCAVRYSLGRRTYMPHLTTAFISPLLPHIDDNALYVMIDDIEKSHSYGDEDIDKPAWMNFLRQCKAEKQRREIK